MILIIIKFGELLLWISLRIINALRTYIKHSKECFICYPNTEKWVQKTRRTRVFFFFNQLRSLGYLMKHSSLCLMYYFLTSLMIHELKSLSEMHKFVTCMPFDTQWKPRWKPHVLWISYPNHTFSSDSSLDIKIYTSKQKKLPFPFSIRNLFDKFADPLFNEQTSIPSKSVLNGWTLGNSQ